MAGRTRRRPPSPTPATPPVSPASNAPSTGRAATRGSASSPAEAAAGRALTVLDAQPRLRTLGAKAQAAPRPREDTMTETPTMVPTAPTTPRRWGDVPPPDDALQVQNLLQMYGFLVDQRRGEELGT